MMLTPIKAIRAKCLDCSCGSAQEVRLCPMTECSLYPYRLGHNPKLKGKRKNNLLQGANALINERFTDETASTDKFIDRDSLKLKSLSERGII